MPKPPSQKNNCDAILPIAREITGFIPFHKGISQNVSVIVWLEFELTYYYKI